MFPLRPLYKTSAASAETVDSSNWDPHEPEAVSGVAASAAVLASHDITQVVSDDVNAPLVTIAIDEAALAPAVLLLQVPYLERLGSLSPGKCPEGQLKSRQHLKAQQALRHIFFWLGRLDRGKAVGHLEGKSTKESCTGQWEAVKQVKRSAQRRSIRE